MVDELKQRGIDVIENLEDVKEKDRIIIRSHGIAKSEYEKIEQKGATIVDATCPYVKYIHKIVEEKYNEGYKIIIVGDANHPEVKGINGWCFNTAIIINKEDELNDLSENIGKVCLVAQTTYNKNKWYSIASEIIKRAKEILIFNTICSATDERQREAIELSKKVDVMIVIGGKNSSNSRKLFEICLENCKKAIFIEDENELNLDEIKGLGKIGVTAGASTPDYTINAVVEKIKLLEYKPTSNDIKEEQEQYDYNFKVLNVGDIIEAKIIHITNDEVFLDLGYKSDGILPKELASNKEIKLSEKFKVGDTIDVEVVKLSDKDGNVVVSRLNIEKYDIINELEDIKNKEDVIKVKVVNEIKEDLIVIIMV